MKIHSDFLGGNIEVVKQNENDIYLNNQLRDTSGDWFYWAFCTEGAEGKEIKFHMQENRLGYWGPAVSYDLNEWHWLNSVDGNTFTYKFSNNESKVYFAHSMLYHPNRFIKLADELSLNTFCLCKSKKGRDVPAYTFGNGNISIVLTARHHACESTGNYVLEGVLRELKENPIDNIKVFCVPFVDFDGVIDGDQGKSRIPHDHNRDYLGNESLYPETSAIQKYVEKNGCNYGFDFHSPWHKGEQNDKLFNVENHISKHDRVKRFAELTEKNLTEDGLKYTSKSEWPPRTDWNQDCPSFGYIMNHRAECELAHTFECAYFGTEDNKISGEKMITFGRCYARAMKDYINGR